MPAFSITTTRDLVIKFDTIPEGQLCSCGRPAIWKADISRLTVCGLCCPHMIAMVANENYDSHAKLTKIIKKFGETALENANRRKSFSR